MNNYTSPTPSAHRSSAAHYVDAMITSASPARLRLMLLERAVEVANLVASIYRENDELNSGLDYSLKLFEIVNELLSGITSKEGVGEQVSDLYVFLAKHVLLAEEQRDADAIDEIRLVLETEAETWRMVCANEAGMQSQTATTSAGPAGGLNLQG